MGFLNAAIDRISNSSIKEDERILLVNYFTALDDDLVNGGYDPTPTFIKASKDLDEYLLELESEEDEIEVEVDLEEEEFASDLIDEDDSEEIL